MIKFKQSLKRNLRWDKSDDLSIITGGRPVINVGGGSITKLKRVSKYDERLKRDFASARTIAYLRKGERPPDLPPHPNHLATATKSPYFNNEENDRSSSLMFPIPSTPHPQLRYNGLEGPRPQNGQYTISSVPPLVNVSHYRKSQRSKSNGILKSVVNQSPVFTNNPLGSEGHHYFSFHANSGQVQKPKLATTVYSMNSKASGKKVSSWKICSSMPMTRMDASLVQMEMASTMCGSQSGSSNNFNFQSSLLPNQNQQFGDYPMLPPRQAVPSLVKSIIPPPSPLLPNTPDTNFSNASSNFSSCGVYQSEWMDRSKCMASKALTKQYSMEQIIDILCGFATPDSIMADQLFQPLPSAPPSSSATSFKIPLAPSNTNVGQSAVFDASNYQNTGERDHGDDDGETSIYFRQPPKKKSVSFLTDQNDNICVKEHFFDPFSQEHQKVWAELNEHATVDKENLDPNMFENFLPIPKPSQSNPDPFIGIGPSESSLSTLLNPSTLPEGGNIFDAPCSNTNGPGTGSENGQLNSVSPYFSDSSLPSEFETCSIAKTDPNEAGSSFLFPVGRTSNSPLFELNGDNTVGLIDFTSNKTNECLSSSSTDNTYASSQISNQMQQQLTETNHVDSQNASFASNSSTSLFDGTKTSTISNLSSPSKVFENIHPSWEALLNDISIEYGQYFFEEEKSGSCMGETDNIMNNFTLETPKPQARILP